MAERAASLVDEVLPRVPVRQWVLTLPYRLRYRLAWDTCPVPRGPGRVCARAPRLLRAHGPLTRHPRRADRDGHGDTARFGSGLQLNVHFHTLVLDGVFSAARPGPLTFHPAPPPSDDDVAHVLATVRARVGRLLARRHLEPADDTAPADPLAEASPGLAGCTACSRSMSSLVPAVAAGCA
jgi:hypothetical protein